MKKRLYQRNVVDAIPKINKQRDDFAREWRKKLGFTLLAFVFCVAAACCCSVFISRFAVYLFIPVMVRIFSHEFYCCYQNFKLLKIMSLDYNDYAVWMKNQLNKGNTKKDIQFQTSIETYKKYAIDFPYNHSEIYQDLQNLLKDAIPGFEFPRQELSYNISIEKINSNGLNRKKEVVDLLWQLTYEK